MIATNYGEVFSFSNTYNPIALTLDIRMPETNGWKVLDLFKNDLRLRHIPIHLVSGEENSELAFQRGARSFLQKPLNNDVLDNLFKDIISFHEKKVKEVLVVEDNEMDSSRIAGLFHKVENLKVTIASTGKTAIKEWKKKSFDCIILDYKLPDTTVSELVKEFNSKKQLQLTPIIIYTAKDFTPREMIELRRITNTVVLKDVNSLDNLMEESIMHLHIDFKDLPEEVKNVIEGVRIEKDVLKEKKVLIVDDDVRNLFALTTAFERYAINAITAESGKEAINILNESPDIDLVLMDIMMPEMDGYETIQKIRRENKNINLPIIAVTAKAMKGDRQKCIEAGASDYITKPVKVDQLLSLMRIWLYK
jgi:CheY-like chemotaxis protein